ncbi:protein-glutamate O-methyltransferase CheR [Sulfuricella sp.]|uniref:CheR family methyltransferase n=1 Tax=Sulfuricella sp. TaxID=2099377 RepID=UPI002C1C261E|nr:protein-glutamate O-methyltransferase CheR [Sulfuricella sp.]HUX64777.1 protein-glutamate O-methyltransferase CheR [Sulfuricella sp.]
MDVQKQIISDREFGDFRNLLYGITGINLSAGKKALVSGRLAKRLRERQLESYGEYFRFLSSGQDPAELQTAIDLLTTNETYFFREAKHFEFLREQILPQFARNRPFRVWSAASSSGEEPYSIAMTLADCLGEESWEVFGSDISSRVLEKARSGHYLMERAKDLPRQHLVNYCLKGVKSQAGTFLIDQRLKSRMRFQQVNLNADLPGVGEFDVIFLRNVMIYFDTETKRRVVERLWHTLKPQGYLIIGHSESLNGVFDRMQVVKPSVYRKP